MSTRKLIGKVSATEKNPSSCDEFQFWMSDDTILSPFDIVLVQNKTDDSITYGVVQDMFVMLNLFTKRHLTANRCIQDGWLSRIFLVLSLMNLFRASVFERVISLLATEPLLRISSHLKATTQTECLQGRSMCFMMSWFPIPRETILNQAQLIMR